MTINEYKQLYPRNDVFIQTDDTERIMTPEEYEIWVFNCVEYENHDPLAP